MAKKSKQSRTGEIPQPESLLAIVPEVVEPDGLQPFEELTEDESRDRLFFERKVERAFYEAGKALKELRNKRLYRSTHHTFEAYCQDRFGYGRRPVNLLIAASGICDNLGSNGSQIMPTSERQVRPLTPLEADEQVEAWQKAVSEAGGKVPPARIVSDVVQRIRSRTSVPNPWRVGDVCTIVVKENPELRGYGGCWAIVADVHQFCCTVQMWNGRHQVHLENLKELVYSSQQQQELRKLCERLSGIPLEDLSKPVKSFLAELGQLDRPWLTALEETILQAIEKEGSG